MSELEHEEFYTVDADPGVEPMEADDVMHEGADEADVYPHETEITKDESQFLSELFGLYGKVIRKANSRLINKDEADDVAQEVMVRAWNARAKFRGDSELSTWVYRITHNTATTWLERQIRHRERSVTVGEPAAYLALVEDDDYHTEDIVEADMMATEILDVAKQVLSERDYDILMRRATSEKFISILEDYPGLSESGAKVAFMRARRKVEEALEAANKAA